MSTIFPVDFLRRVFKNDEFFWSFWPIWKISNFISKKLDSDKIYDLAIAHSICEEKAEHLRKLLYDKHPNIKSISILELGCALGSHTGPGTLAVGVQEHLSI